MNSKLCIVVNTVSHCSDIWEMFFEQLNTHFPNNKIYVFTDIAEGLPDYCTPIIYDSNKNFRTQYLESIKQVNEEITIYLNEDYILYDDVNVKLINEYVEIMINDKTISFIKTNKSGVNNTLTKYGDRDDLFYMDSKGRYFFSQNTAIWRTRDLEKIHELGPDLHIANLKTTLQFEVEANKICKDLDLTGLFMYHDEKLRGKYHYDSDVFPYIATAIIKGKWNLNEYREELTPLLEKYNIDESIRGTNI